MDLTLIKIEATANVDALVAAYRRDYPHDSISMVLANLVECADQELQFVDKKNPIAATRSETRSARYKHHAKIVASTMTSDEIEWARRALCNGDITLSDWI